MIKHYHKDNEKLRMKNGEWRIICNTTDIQIAFYINFQFSILNSQLYIKKHDSNEPCFFIYRENLFLIFC